MRRIISVALLLAGALLVSAAGPAAALAPDVVATGNLNGEYKPRNCVFEPNVVFDVDLTSGDGRLEMVGWGALSCIVGTQITAWTNYCRGEADGKITCGDGNFSTDNATAVLEPDGEFTFENELWRFTGPLARVSTAP